MLCIYFYVMYILLCYVYTFMLCIYFYVMYILLCYVYTFMFVYVYIELAWSCTSSLLCIAARNRNITLYFSLIDK